MKINHILFIIFLTFSICSCKQNSDLTYPLPTTNFIDSVTIILDSVKVEGDLGDFSVEKTETEETDGVQLITFKFSANQPSELPPTTIHFNFPSVDVFGYWNPKISIDKVNYFNNGVTSKASRNAPVLAFYNGELKNRMTMALSDALNQSEFNSWLKEEDVNFHPRIYLFREKMPKTTSYEVTLRIDTRELPYYESIDDVASWWANMSEYKPMQVPEAAKEPMYSTWYSYHQSITAEEIIAECKIAKTLGCGAVIIDDGWQTNDGNRGYAYTGDWNPDRISDMKGFVEAVHNEGMKFLLWYSLPFMGENAENYSKFKGKYLRYWDGQGTYVMDPRYPEVREYIVNTYIKAMQDWNLDGFKLDFIGRFTATDDTVLTKADGRDYASVNDATDVLMTEVTNKLTAIKPDILIEFRQPYIGPVMRKYGNMFRVVDAPNNAVANKIETTNLRILSQNTAVHSDMFIWRPEENVEQAALQILNILYSVPQLSVRLEEIPENHLNMIRFWFKYWNNNKHILMDGKFIPSNPTANYPWLSAIANQKQITTLYEDVVVTVDDNAKQIDLINAKASTSVVFKLEHKSNAAIKIIDCKGIIIFEEHQNFNKGVHSIEVPMSGMLSIAIE
jgi:alpha-galactosidase